MKFSQVEFVVILARIMYQHRVLIVREEEGRETEDQVTERVTRVVNDCDMQLLLRMRDPERVRLRCVRRE
jgi:hypothetical protein